MDRFSGSVPRKLISFRLGKSNVEDRMPTATSSDGPQLKSSLSSKSEHSGSGTNAEPQEIIATPVKAPSSLGANETVCMGGDDSHQSGQPASPEGHSSTSDSVGSFIDKFLSERESVTELRSEDEDVNVVDEQDTDGTMCTSPEKAEKPTDPRLLKRKMEFDACLPKLIKPQDDGHDALPHFSGSIFGLPRQSESDKILLCHQEHDYVVSQAKEVIQGSAGLSETIVATNEDSRGLSEDSEKEACSSLVGGRKLLATTSLNPVVSSAKISITPGNSEDEAIEYRNNLHDSGGHELTGDSNTLIGMCFERNPPLRFPSGHVSVSLSEPQISCLVKTVAEESSVASFRMMKEILLKAAALRPLHDSKPKASDKFRSNKQTSGPSHCSSGDESADNRGEGYDSSGLNSEDGFKSLVYDNEKVVVSDGEMALVSSLINPPPKSPDTPGTSKETETFSSQDHVPLSTVRDELRKPRSVVRKTTSERNASRRRIPDHEKADRPRRILREESFEGMEWTRIFACGPMEPDENKYSFFCMFCKRNVSMYGKGRSELVRHYRRKSHFRLDQRWRYEYLKRFDSVSGTPKHYVRGLDGKLLSPVELRKEIPFFENVRLVEIGARFPYYTDYVQGVQHSGIASEDRASIQLSVFCKFLPSCGNLSFLSRFWNEVGTVTNHQSLFANFDWTSDRLSVSIFPFFVHDYFNVLCLPIIH